MCRISGTVNYPPSVCVDLVEHQKRGGPDHSGVLKINDKTWLGHTLLSIIGHCEQPVESERYAMTFNGAWYSYKDYYPYETSDTIALLKHFNRHGLNALKDVLGMFAIGLYDTLEQKIHLIVDRFGEKQLYYYHDGDKFAFASNPGALYPLLPEKKINRDALQSYWLLGSVMGEDSILQGIKKVCASEMVTFDLVTNLVTRKRWYEPKERIAPIEELVYDAIDKVKVSDVPVYIFLSGGIDSTLVASRFEGGHAIHLDSPELEYAKQVAGRFKIDLKTVQPEDIEPEQVLMDYSEFSGEPTMAGMIPYITAKEVSKFARVAVTANGADEISMGYNRTHDIVQDEQIKHIFRDISKNIHTHCHTEFGKSTYHGRMLELGSYVQFDLNKTLDFASMAHGVEMRSPFLDYRLVEAALSIPEATHRKRGNKTILRDMVKKLGFSDQFTDRPKLGFSLHKKPKDLDTLLQNAWLWCRHNGFLDVDEKKLSGRDYQYLRMSALGFYYFYKTIFK